jgi:hypothetical protein
VPSGDSSLRDRFLTLFFAVLVAVVAAGAWMRIRTVDEAVRPPATVTEETQPQLSVNDPTQPAGSPELAASPALSPAASAPYDDSPKGEETPASARDRRYRELLKAPPPPAPVRSAAEPSLINRVTASIANAIGATPRKPPPPAARPATPSQAPRPAGATSSPPAPRDEEKTPPPATSTGEEQDPETDITPPQLQTAEFVPPEIKDDETTTLIATVVDNIAGVRSVSGVIASPSGSVQGFSAAREGEGNRFVARVKVPRDAPEGTWTVKYMTLIDNAANSAHLNQVQGALPATASFRVVSSGADASGPQLASIWLERPAMRSGERNTVFVKADDDKAGVSLVSGMFISPGRAARLGFGCRQGQGGAWECPLTAPTCIDCGIWKLEQVQVQDKAGNLATFRVDNPAVSSVVVDISSDKCDGVPPSITMVAVEPAVVANTQPSTIQVRAIVIDDGPCGVASVSGQAVPPGGVGGQRHPIVFRPSGDGQTFLGTLNLQQSAVRGQWSVSWMQVLDRGNNLKAYSGSDPALSKATFRVD